MVTVAYRRWLFYFTRGSNCKALTGKILVGWFEGRLLEVFAYKRWLHMEVCLYMYYVLSYCVKFIVLLTCYSLGIWCTSPQSCTPAVTEM